MTYPEIKYGKIYRVKTKFAYDTDEYKHCFRMYSRRVTRYVMRWRKNVDSYFISPYMNVMDTYLSPLSILDLDLHDVGEGVEPLFTDIEEMKDLDLFLQCSSSSGALCIRNKDFNDPNFCPFSSALERAPYYVDFEYYTNTWIYGFGVLMADLKERKVHFESHPRVVDDVIRCSVRVDKDCHILMESGVVDRVRRKVDTSWAAATLWTTRYILK